MSSTAQEVQTEGIRPQILEILLKDRTTKKNILWGTANYKNHGKGFLPEDQMDFLSASEKARFFVKSRTSKSETEQKRRSKDMAEVFTPSWICNIQNNVIDAKWFGHEGSFNVEKDNDWAPTDRVVFDSEKDWKQYVEDIRSDLKLRVGKPLI